MWHKVRLRLASVVARHGLLQIGAGSPLPPMARLGMAAAATDCRWAELTVDNPASASA